MPKQKHIHDSFHYLRWRALQQLIKPLTIIANRSLLEVAEVLDTPLVTNATRETINVSTIAILHYFS